MRSLVIVDASALYAAADTNETDHRACVDVLSRRDLDLVIPALAIAEAAYLVGTRLGPGSEAAFIRGLAGFAVEAPAAEDWPVIANVVERYADLRLGTTDASIAVLADRLKTDLIVTLDRRHFGTVRAPSGRPFAILPELRSAHEEAAAYTSVS